MNGSGDTGGDQSQLWRKQQQHLHKYQGLSTLSSPPCLSGGLAQHCCSRFSAADPAPEHAQHPLHGEEHSRVSMGSLLGKELENEQLNARESK